MANILPRNAGYVCRACRSRQSTLQYLVRPSLRLEASSSAHQTYRAQSGAASSKTPIPSANKINSRRIQPQRRPPPPSPSAETQPRIAQTKQPTSAAVSDVPIDAEDVRGTLRDIQTRVNAICASTSLPDTNHVLETMDKAFQFANVLVFGQTTAPEEETVNSEEEEASDKDLFSELEEPYRPTRQSPSPASTLSSSLSLSYRERSAQALSEAIYTLLKDPKVHISQEILAAYVRIICQLGLPEFLPEIFFLYANKPQPILNSNPIQFRKPSPGLPKNAIPQELSDVALDTAILQRDLALAVAIIDTTVSTRAFRLNKFIKKASLPLAFVGSTPIAAYAAADWVSNWQNSLDPGMAKAITLMGSAAYIGTLTTIGFVAVTTYNDHHERVRWMEGTPLRYRWTREEERLYFDRIAMAWGFQRTRRRGEEMGDLWEELREECGVRGFMLDKSELLPGMQ